MLFSQKKKKHSLCLVAFGLANILSSCAFSQENLSQSTTVIDYLSQSNYASSTGSGNAQTNSLTFTDTNLEGNLWADKTVMIDLNFQNGRFWKMDQSGIQIKNGSNIIIHTSILPITTPQTTISTLQIQQDTDCAFNSFELINSGAKVMLWQKGDWRENTNLANTFTLRGTTLETYWGNGSNGRTSDGLHGNTANGIHLVFAKGNLLDTTITDTQNQTLKLTNPLVDQNHTGKFINGVYDGNYIAQSYGKITKIVTNGAFDITFIGENSYSDANWSGGSFGEDSKLTLINASDKNGFDAGKIGAFFNNSSSARADIYIEGTSLKNGNSIVTRSSNQDKLNFHITFVDENTLFGTNADSQYLGDIYQDVATTTANHALKDSILKVAESKLVDGIDFKNSNAYVTFIGDSGLSSSKILKNGSALSVYTFRASSLSLGSSASSIQGIKGTIAFDLGHFRENIQFGYNGEIVKNMFDGGGSGKYQTIYNLDGEKLAINRLVFADPSQLSSLPTLSTLAINGNYFGDSGVFENLGDSERREEYIKIGKMQGIDPNQNSRLNTLFKLDFAINGSQQEIIFVGEKSHRFANNISNGKDDNRLGNSADSMLTFIDAGTIFRERIMNISNGSQQGKGTINLVGTTQMELQTIGDKQTLTLADGIEKGAGLTLNAIFTGENPLGNGKEILADAPQSTTTPTAGHKASNANIGVNDEETIFHLLFDYTSSNLSFGEHQAYTGTISGLTKASKIKFKNAGYIENTQIIDTEATIIFENTQLRKDFRNDQGVLDYRNNKINIAGSILSSDINNIYLSRKILTFDFTNTTGFGYQFRDSYKIQAGNKVAQSYTSEADSILTFQNAPDILLNTSRTSLTLLEGLANSTGFKSFGNASLTDEDFAQNYDTRSYILKGTDLIFEGTSIFGDIIENNYDLTLTFDTASTHRTQLSQTIQTSSFQGSITMGEGRDLSLTFNNQNSLQTKNLSIKLADNAIFKLTTTSSDGKIGTIIINKNPNIQTTQPLSLSAKSIIDIQSGSMSFIGHFDTTKDLTTPSNEIGAFSASFGDQGTKTYGVINHKGELSLTLTQNALFTDAQAQSLGYSKTSDQFANLVINLATPSSLNLTLNHTQGIVGLIGEEINLSNQQFSNFDLTSSTGQIAIKGAFDLGSRDTIFDADKKLTIAGDTYFKVQNNRTLTLSEQGVASQGNATLYIDALGSTNKQSATLTLTNLDPSIQVNLINNLPHGEIWGYNGAWNIRGTNITLDKVFWAETSNNLFKMIFAKGSGRDVAYDPNSSTNSSLTLDALTGEDKISLSSLTGTFSPNTNTSGNYHNNGDGSSLILKNASLTFIGREALGISAGDERIDGSFNRGGRMEINLYNSIIRSGSILLDSSVITGTNNRSITDFITLQGTDTFNLSVSKISLPAQASGKYVANNNSTLNATFINNSLTTTGESYIENSSIYALSNAGGALSENILKTLYSKAYGNITLDSSVSATIKFIGENSHSFDGKTAVYNANNRTNSEFYYNPAGDSTQNNWKKIEISSQGIAQLSQTSLTQTSDIALATLSGGNANSRFDFDHTSVKLDLIKNAGGKTYIYNSNLIDSLSVDSNTNNGSTTIFFNQIFNATNPLSQTAQKFVNFYQNNYNINLDLSTPHTLKNSNLVDNKLTSTSKTTNLIFIGKKANEATKDGDQGISLSFLPQALMGSGYNYTIVSGGLLDLNTLRDQLGQNIQDLPNDPTGIMENFFGASKVHLIDTEIVGRISFGHVGFVNVEKTQHSMWAGVANQYLIFNFNNGKSNLSMGYQNDYAIQNRSNQSRYIFTGIFENSDRADSNRYLILTKNGLKDAINTQLARKNNTISEFAVGYLGLRGISVKGDIDEDYSEITGVDNVEPNGNSVDIVFNSTRNIAYKEWFDENGEHQASFELGYANLVSTGLDDDTKISGYAVLKPMQENGDVAIKGNAHKDIVFIGKNAVEGGFEHLKISEGSSQSSYQFHSVGTLNSQFLQGVRLQKSNNISQGNLGIFRFYNSTIYGDIDIDKNTSDPNTFNTTTLFFDNVVYHGTISGTLIKNLKFAEGSQITLLRGNDKNIYDFSNLANKEVHLNIDMLDSKLGYYSPTFIGLDQGNVSVVGYFNLAMEEYELIDNIKTLPIFAFNNQAKWTITGDSRLANLTISNNSTSNFNLDLYSAPRPISLHSSFRTLDVGVLVGDNGQILLGSNIDTQDPANSSSDQIKTREIRGSLTLMVKDAQTKKVNLDTQKTPLVLIHTQQGNATIQGRKDKEGLMIYSTNIQHQIIQNGVWEAVTEENFDSQAEQRWVLSSLTIEENTNLINESGALISNPYRMLLIESNNLNKRMGDLRNNPYPQGSWIRVFNGMDSGEGLKNLYTNIQLGYDYSLGVLGGKDYLGVALSTSIVNLTGESYKGEGNTYSIALYDSYITDFGLYVDSIFKYLYTSQSLTPDWGEKTDFGNHALSLGLEIGYQAYIAKSDFYLEPQVEFIYGYIQGVQNIDLGIYGGKQILGELESTHSLYLRAGGVMGYTFKTQKQFSADLRVGASFVSEQISNANPIHFNDSEYFIHQSISNDIKALVSIGTNLSFGDQWRMYLDVEKTFGGKRNTDYQANIGARFSFGEKPLKKEDISPTSSVSQ